jgi:hypothetical protein
MKTIKSFGCSFIYGSDLKDSDLTEKTNPSKLVWPAVIAKNLDLSYRCYAKPGQGNLKIFSDILANSYKNDHSIYIVNWTWIDRFDYITVDSDWSTVMPNNSGSIESFYYRNLHNQITDMINTCSYIISSVEHLVYLNCPFIMTYMDHNLFTAVDPTWHNPRYVDVMQQKLKTMLQNFDDLNFLEWSQKNNYSISKGWHPLEDAHAAAADYWLPAVKKLL